MGGLTAGGPQQLPKPWRRRRERAREKCKGGASAFLLCPGRERARERETHKEPLWGKSVECAHAVFSNGVTIRLSEVVLPLAQLYTQQQKHDLAVEAKTVQCEPCSWFL